MRPAQFRVDRTSERVRMVAQGDLDLSTAPAFSKALVRLFAAGRTVDVDLGAVAFIDAYSVKMLTRAARDARTKHTRLSFVGASAPIAEVIRLCGAGWMLSSA